MGSFNYLVSKFLFWVVTVLVLHSYESNGCFEKEKSALLQFKNQYLNSTLPYMYPPNFSPSWINETSQNCCSWEGVRCDPSSGHILGLLLSSSQYVDTWCPYSASLNMTVFQDLQHLQNLDLRGLCITSLDGAEAICKMRSLQVLNLALNDIQNEGIPDCIGNLNSLAKLNLSHNSFTGNVPPGVCNLKGLQVLDLSVNELNGSIPTCIGNLDLLTELILSWNTFTGTVPSGVCKWRKLQNLDLHMNSFSGSLPTCIGNLASLEMIDLSLNSFVGKFPLSLLANHTRLTHLDLSYNMLDIETEDSLWMPSFQLEFLGLGSCNLNKETQTIPKFLSHQYHLIELGLGGNNLVGSFLDFVSQSNSQPQNLTLNLPLTSLESLDLSYNNFSGNLPENINVLLPNLKVLDLSSNNFEGEVPKQLFNNSNLGSLSLSKNNFQGPILPKYINLPEMDTLKLDNNHFNGSMEDSLWKSSNVLQLLDISENEVSGRMPSWIGDLKKLQYLVVHNNILHGYIPDQLCNLSSLDYLDLSRNSFTGELLSCNSSLSSLSYMYLNDNNFTGPLPQELSTSSGLVELHLSDNQLEGIIPSWIGQLSSMEVLQLANNAIQGILPSELCQLRDVNILDVANNRISGSVPPCLKGMSFGRYETLIDYYDDSYLDFLTKGRDNVYDDLRSMSAMSGLDLSSNQFSGHIPKDLGYLTGLRSLNLSHNKLDGLIPTTFSNLANIESLDLSYNNLSGPVPEQLSQLNFLEVFNVSYNNLSGRVPTGHQFGTFDVTSYVGNPLLSGYDQGSTVIGREPPKAALGEDEEDEGNSFDWRLFFWSFGPSYIIFLLGSIAVLYNKPQWLNACLIFIKMYR